MAATAAINSSPSTSIPSNPTSTNNVPSSSSSSSSSLPNNNSTKTAADQIQNGVVTAPPATILPKPKVTTKSSSTLAFLDCFKPKPKVSQSQPTQKSTTTTTDAGTSNSNTGSTTPTTAAATTTTTTDSSSTTAAATTTTTTTTTDSSSSTTAAAATTTDSSSTTAASTTVSEADALCNLINAELSFIKNASKILQEHQSQINAASTKFDKLQENKNPDELRKLKKSVMRLKQQISSKSKDESKTAKENHNSLKNDIENVDQVDANKLLEEMPHLYKVETFEQSSAFRDFEVLYNSLSSEKKLCLLCFSVFPEEVTIKKRVLIYWWIAEGFVPSPTNPKTSEEIANEFFKELMVMGFIEPVYEKRSLVVDCCKMHPFVRSAIITLADRAKFFDFDPYGRPKAEYVRSLRACLVGEGLTNFDDLEKLHMMFNVNEKILELKPEWFLKMKNVNILYLGRWQTLATHHIEVEETKFLDGLGSMNHLKFLSLQGISRITVLPESISNLTNLTILDLRACHNLDEIPEKIGLLKSLTHLDMSECYLLDHMPKGLKSLNQLQVLKGFVAGELKGKNFCSLQDLVSLPKLRKLSIYTGLKEFPREPELKALNRMWELQKLTIAWGRTTTPETAKAEDGGANVQQKNTSAETPTATAPKLHRGLARRSAFNQAIASSSGVPELPSQLQKLDLQCFPRTNAPKWLKPSNLKEVKKLYIRGGKLGDLGQILELNDERTEKDTWAVKILRLKYLTELEMDWIELRELFPHLIYVEKVKCPKLTFFPCNETGVWVGKTESNF